MFDRDLTLPCEKLDEVRLKLSFVQASLDRKSSNVMIVSGRLCAEPCKTRCKPALAKAANAGIFWQGSISIGLDQPRQAL